MQPFQTITGRAYPLGLSNIDTDVIIAAEWLKTVTRTGLRKAAFATLRARRGNVFDDPRYADAPILVTGSNFGCGSSREHAAWALADMGIRVVIAPSFSDIFAGNAFKNGILTIALNNAASSRLLEAAHEQNFTVDLAEQCITLDDGDRYVFEVDPFRRECLLGGLDEIELTLCQEAAIAAFEQR